MFSACHLADSSERLNLPCGLFLKSCKNSSRTYRIFDLLQNRIDVVVEKEADDLLPSIRLARLVPEAEAENYSYEKIILNLFVAEAVGGVVVNHPQGLHVGIDNRRADKAEASFFQVFAKSIRFGCLGWNLFK